MDKYSVKIFSPNMANWKAVIADFFLNNMPLLKIGRINRVLKKFIHLKNEAFIDEVMRDLKIKVEFEGLECIPKEGAVTIAANHPGGADIFAMISALGEVRPDMNILANKLVCVNHVKDIVIPVDTMTKSNKVSTTAIDDAYEREEVVVFFAAGMNSRYNQQGELKDRRWRTSFLQYSQQYDAPVVLAHISGQNTPLFYKVAAIRKKYKSLKNVPLENIFQLREFVKAKGTINVRFSAPIYDIKCPESNDAQEQKKFCRNLADQFHNFVYAMKEGCQKFIPHK